MAPSAYLGRADDHPRIRWIGGMTLQIVLDSAASNGQLMIMRNHAGRGDATPVHVHHREDEVFHVLDGTITVWVGNQRREAGSGDACWLPRGVPHAFRVTSDTATLLVMCTPAGLEQAFQEAGWTGPVPPPPEWTLTPQAIGHAMAKRDCQILGPPRAAADGPIITPPSTRAVTSTKAPLIAPAGHPDPQAASSPTYAAPG